VEIKIRCPKCQKALKAPESQAGKRAKCPGCGTIISIPEIVHEAEEVPEEPALPPTPNMQSLLDEEQEYRLAEGPKVSTPAQEPMRRPCPMCGEMIVLGAAKCRYCDTILDERLREAEKKKKRYSSEDSDLTGFDWFLVIICSGIGCIMGVVYMIQGKPKGWKMIGLSILCDIVKSVIWTIIQASMNQGQFGR
jgi:phage FluMu protein Com